MSAVIVRAMLVRSPKRKTRTRAVPANVAYPIETQSPASDLKVNARRLTDSRCYRKEIRLRSVRLRCRDAQQQVRSPASQ